MKIISIANRKGGVLKSTTALSLAILLSRKDIRVLLIDFDPQHSLSETFCTDKEIEKKAFYNALLDLQETKDCIIELSPTLHFMPTDLEFEHFPSKMTSLGMVNQYVVLEKLEELNTYDYIIIDCPPGNPYLNTLALSASKYVVVPTHRSNWTSKGTTFILDSIKELKKSKKSVAGIEQVILLPTSINRKKRLLFSDSEFAQYTSDLKKQFKNGFIKVSDVNIPHDEDATRIEDLTREQLPTAYFKVFDVYEKFVNQELLND